MFVNVPVSWLVFLLEQFKERTTLSDKLEMGHVKDHSHSSDKNKSSF